MERELHVIHIIPARFIKRELDKYLIRCLIGTEENGYFTEDRLFDTNMLNNIPNLNYLFIGIMTGVGILETTCVDANEFDDVFNEKWNILTK